MPGSGTPVPRPGDNPARKAEPQSEGPRKEQGNVVDADFEVVDEDKK